MKKTTSLMYPCQVGRNDPGSLRPRTSSSDMHEEESDKELVEDDLDFESFFEWKMEDEKESYDRPVNPMARQLELEESSKQGSSSNDSRRREDASSARMVVSEPKRFRFTNSACSADVSSMPFRCYSGFSRETASLLTRNISIEPRKLKRLDSNEMQVKPQLFFDSPQASPVDAQYYTGGALPQMNPLEFSSASASTSASASASASTSQHANSQGWCSGGRNALTPPMVLYPKSSSQRFTRVEQSHPQRTTASGGVSPLREVFKGIEL